jgi:hypothetical protein
LFVSQEAPKSIVGERNLASGVEQLCPGRYGDRLAVDQLEAFNGGLWRLLNIS